MCIFLKYYNTLVTSKICFFRGVSCGGFGGLDPRLSKGAPKKEEKGKERERKKERKRRKERKEEKNYMMNRAPFKHKRSRVAPMGLQGRKLLRGAKLTAVGGEGAKINESQGPLVCDLLDTPLFLLGNILKNPNYCTGISLT